MVKEQRKEKRFKEELRVTIELPGHGASPDLSAVNALTQDISLGGARITTDALFAVGTVLNMGLYLSRTRQLVKVQCEVRWTRPLAAGLFEMGVEFRHGIPLSVMALINHLYGKDPQVPTSVHAKNSNAPAG